jgi:outer membrane receptor protein involved in Fe transport
VVRPLHITFLLCTFAFASPLYANGIAGTVKDATGATLPDAEVIVLTAQRAVVATARTGGTGRFDLSHVPPGSYLVIVRAAAFGEEQIAAVVRADQPTNVDVTLQIARVAEDVTVTAVPGEVREQRHAAQPVNVISAEEIERRARTVLAQAVEEEPGVALQRTSPTMAGVFVRGLTGNKVNVFVDGIRYSNGAQRGGVNTFFDLVEPTGLESIEILRGPNSAEYGSDALGGSIQLLGRVPALSPDGAPRFGGRLGIRAGTAHQMGAGNLSLSYSRAKFGLFGNLAGQRVGELRPGGAIDSHSAISRFLGLPSSTFVDERLPDTGYRQAGGQLKANWTPGTKTQIVSSYVGTRQDGGERWDQLLGGDGNLIASLNDVTLDLFYVRVERVLSGWFDHASVTYSLNTQREERVNQGGNGNPRATIGHEPERTTVNGVQGALYRQISPRQTLNVGGELYLEKLTSDAFNVNPVNGAVSPRRPRIPSDATYRNAGIFAQTGYDLIPDRMKLVGSMRWGGVRYQARAADAPIVAGRPLWPDDELSTSAVTFRAGAVATPHQDWSFSSSLSRGYRAPHMTDLGTLGLTGSGFEVAYPEVSSLGATVGSSAAATAVSTGQPVEQVGPESSIAWDATARYRRARIRGELSVFVNNVYDNIQKQALILPPGAAGTSIAGEPITQQEPNGAVFVASSTSPVLVRDNFDDARIWGVEASGEVPLMPALTLNTTYTFTRARDLATDLAPNIEGGTPAPTMWLMVRYAPPAGTWWVQPYIQAAAEQSRLSSLDLGDRRIGAERTRASIRNFFLNGATARGWVSSGPDATIGTADDVLAATGETLAQIQNRVLGNANSSVLFPAVKGFTAVGVRGGIRLGRHELFIDAENVTDENYRGISWGMDAPGIGVNLRYVLRF